MIEMIAPFQPRLPFSNTPTVQPNFVTAPVQANQDINTKNQPPEMGLPRGQQFIADASGCGHYRCIWIEQMLNAHAKMVVHSSTLMYMDPRAYIGIKSVRLQRQATPQQLEFAKFLKEVSKQNGMRLLYEIDDQALTNPTNPEIDIPKYNKYRDAFTNPEIQRCMREIMAMCDEITCTCPYLRDILISESGNKNVTVIPNFLPKFWIGNHYDLAKNMANLELHKKRPRILYAGSGAHFDVDNKTGHKDDFDIVHQTIRKTAKKYKYIFMGAFPIPLIDLIKDGTIEFHPWCRLYEYAQKISDIGANMLIAPLQDNTFNRCKSDIKLIEAGAFGLPIACQDIVTYADAPIRFKTGDEMVDQIDKALGDSKYYKSLCKKARAHTETRWLESDANIDCYVELFTTPYGDPKRKNLSRYNKV